MAMSKKNQGVSADMASDDPEAGSALLRKAKAAAKEAGGEVVIEVHAGEIEDEGKDVEPPKEARIKKAENGYIVCWYDNSGKQMMYSGEKSVIAKDLNEAMAALKKYMG